MSLPQLSLQSAVSGQSPEPRELRVSCSEFYIRDQGHVVPVSVCSIGSEAYQTLQQSQLGHVLAVFRRSFYVQCDRGIVCIGSALLGKGPLHVLLASDRDDLFVDVACGQSVSIGEVPQLSCESNRTDCAYSSVGGSNTTYSGKLLAQGSFRFSERHTLILHECGAASRTEHGFGWLLQQHCWHPERGLSDFSTGGLDVLDHGLRQLSFTPLQALYGWLVESLGQSLAQISIGSTAESTIGADDRKGSISNEPSSEVHKLLGAGPGLTPAGDDLLAGVMLALYSIRRADMANLLWITLQPWLGQRTNAISIAHLRLAAQGQCSEVMLVLLQLFCHEGTHDSADDVQSIARSVQKLATKMGASSGWDTLAGVSLVVRAMSGSPCVANPL